MKIDIDKLSREELIELNDQIIERLKFLDSMGAHSEMMQFLPGEQVTFDSGREGRLIASIVKFNKKTITVITESGKKWNVSPYLLSKIKNAKGKRDKIGKVIDINVKK